MSHERRSRAAGFTLVELLVATLLMTLILGAVYTAFNTTTRAWRAGEATMASYQGVRTSVAVMTRELQCLVPGAEHLFEGTSDELTFYAVTRPLNPEEGLGARLLQIRYRLKDDPDRRGYILVREEAPVEDALPLRTEPDEEINTGLIETGLETSFDLAGDIRDMELSYYWLPPPEPTQSALTPAPAAPVQYVIKEENELGWGLPQGLRIRFRLRDTNAEGGETVFTTFVTFQGPTTVLDKKEADRLGGPV